MGQRPQVYRSDEITVTFDSEVCIHSAVCLENLPQVFDLAHRRWVRLEKASAEQVADVVRRCPSGALQCTTGESEGGE